MALGADSIDHADVLLSGATERLLGHKAMAPSTLGTFLRSCGTVLRPAEQFRAV